MRQLYPSIAIIVSSSSGLEKPSYRHEFPVGCMVQITIDDSNMKVTYDTVVVSVKSKEGRNMI